MGNGVEYWEGEEYKERIVALQQKIPTSDREVNDVEWLTEIYHKYKRKYVKHICFDPREENLSK